MLEELGRCEKLGEPKPLEPVVQDQSRVQSATIPTSGFYGNRSAPSAPAISSSHANIYPIEALSPYSRTWTIKARCTNKTAVRKWHNRNGEGKLFNITLLDESGEIRATAFKDQCDLLYNVFEEGSVYYISSPCRVQLAKREFSNVNNDYELMFESDTIVEKVGYFSQTIASSLFSNLIFKAEDQNDVPQMRFNFTAVGDLHSVQSGTTIDVIGVLKEVGDTQQIISKTTGKPYAKRDLTLVDNTGFSVRLTIWSETATNFDTATDSIIAFKGVKVSDFGGRSLSLLSSGSMNIDPDIEEAHRLKGWYEAQGRANIFSSQPSLGNSGGKTIERPHKTVAQISEDMLGSSEIPDYFSLKATISTILTENMSYPACLSENCNKKVLQDETGTSWRCEKCDKSHPRPQYRYILSLNVADYTGKIWVNCFDEVGRQILGISADDLTEMKDDFDQRSSFDEVIQNAAFRTWNFTCKARLDTYKEDAR